MYQKGKINFAKKWWYKNLPVTTEVKQFYSFSHRNHRDIVNST